jgi:hypothetical protein
VQNLFGRLATFVNATTTNLAYDSQIGKATSSIFVASSTIENISNFTVFNVTASLQNLNFTLATPTDMTAGKVVYVNNVGSNDFTMFGSTISFDSGRTFVWTGTKWSIHADGTGTASTGPTIITQTQNQLPKQQRQQLIPQRQQPPQPIQPIRRPQAGRWSKWMRRSFTLHSNRCLLNISILMMSIHRVQQVPKHLIV